MKVSFRLLINAIFAAGFFVACGEQHPVPIPFQAEKRHWFHIRGETISPKPVSEKLRTASLKEYENPVATKLNLTLLVPDGSIHPFILSEYAKSAKIGFKVVLYETAQEVRNIISAGQPEVDLMIIPSRLVEEFYNLNYLSRLNFLVISNAHEVDWLPPIQEYVRKNPIYNPDGAYAIPFSWCTVGIAYNKDVITEPVHGYGALLDPKTLSSNVQEHVQGKILMQQDDRLVISAALLYGGHNLNETNSDALAKAQAVLKAQAPYLAKSRNGYQAGYESRDLGSRLAMNEIVMAQATSAQAQQALQANPLIRYILPEEGSPVLINNLAIPRRAKLRTEAERFINFLLDPFVGAIDSNASGFATSNPRARSLVERSTRKGPAYEVPEKALFIREVSRGTVDSYHRIWDELQRSVATNTSSFGQGLQQVR